MVASRMIDPDGSLVAQARAGNKTAFGELVSRHYEMAVAVSFGILNNRELARDTAQEVFLKAYREIQRFESKSKFKTWIYRIAVNTAIDEARKQRPAQSLDMTDAADEDEVPHVIADKKPGPREAAESLEKGDLVRREWQDASYEEIAEALGLGIGTVMSRLFYARKKLAEILAEKLKA